MERFRKNASMKESLCLKIYKPSMEKRGVNCMDLGGEDNFQIISKNCRYFISKNRQNVKNV